MDERHWVIANIPVRKGLEERYCVHVNVASVGNTAVNKSEKVLLTITTYLVFYT